MSIHTYQPMGIDLKPVDTPNFTAKTAFEDPLTSQLFRRERVEKKEGYRPLNEIVV